MKVVRIKLKSGEVRMCGLGNNPSLPQFWAEAEALGFVVGDNWGLKWSGVSHVDLVDVPDSVRLGEVQASDQKVDRIVASIHGGWTPQGAA